MSAPESRPAAGSTRGSCAAYGAMSDAVQNCPVGVTPMPGSPSSLRVSPVPGAGGSAEVTQVVPVGAEEAPRAASSGVRTSSPAPAAASTRLRTDATDVDRSDIEPSEAGAGRSCPLGDAPELAGWTSGMSGLGGTLYGRTSKLASADPIHGPRSQPLSLRANQCREADLAGRCAVAPDTRPGLSCLSLVSQPRVSAVCLSRRQWCRCG